MLFRYGLVRNQLFGQAPKESQLEGLGKLSCAALLSAAIICLCSSSLRAQNQASVHWINDSGQDAVIILNSGLDFVTNFKGSGDLTVRTITGGVNSIYTDRFGGANSGNNPSYVTSFVGDTAVGTGDGTSGDTVLLETRAAVGSIQFDFLSPLTSRDHVLIADADFNESYGIQAFIRKSTGYSQASLLGWAYQNCSGQTGQTPDSTWAAWNPADGSITASSAGLNEPLLILTPDQPIDRLIFSRYAGGSGTAEIQFIAETNSLAWTRLTAERAGSNIVVSWPAAFSNLVLYSNATLTNPAAWSAVTNNPVVSGSVVFVTNAISGQARFYRLQGP